MQERIQKIISAAGIMSRRAAEELITEGRVRVNGAVVTELGSKADPEKDHIKVDGKLINPRQPRTYVLLNKPAGFVTTLSDPEQRPIVQDLLKGVRVRVYPVGRLDYNTEGLLLLTNDGDFAHLITHPSHELPKSYLAKIKGLLDDRETAALENGIYMTDGRTAPARVRRLRKEAMNSWVEITIHEGRKRQVRRMLDHVGHSVIRLKRVRVGNLNLGDLPPGAYRYLTPEEVSSLREMAEGTGQRKEPDAKAREQQAGRAPTAGGKGPRTQRDIGWIPGPPSRSTKPAARGKGKPWGQRPGAAGRQQRPEGREQRVVGEGQRAGERGQRAERRPQSARGRDQRTAGRTQAFSERGRGPLARVQGSGARGQDQRAESRTGSRISGPRDRSATPGAWNKEKARGQGPGSRGRGPLARVQVSGSRGREQRAEGRVQGPGARGPGQRAAGKGPRSVGEGSSWQRPAAGDRRPGGRTGRPAGKPRLPRR